MTIPWAPLAVATWYDCSKSPKGYARFVVAFVVNKKQIWVSIRGLHKSITPSGCDFSVAEHVLSGESYEQAIQRGFAEEANLRISPTDLLPAALQQARA